MLFLISSSNTIDSDRDNDSHKINLLLESILSNSSNNLNIILRNRLLSSNRNYSNGIIQINNAAQIKNTT